MIYREPASVKFTNCCDKMSPFMMHSTPAAYIKGAAMERVEKTKQELAPQPPSSAFPAESGIYGKMTSTLSFYGCGLQTASEMASFPSAFYCATSETAFNNLEGVR